MWKKAITLLMFNIILGIVFIFLSELLNTPQISGFGNIIISCIALQSTYYDIYRKKELLVVTNKSIKGRVILSPFFYYL